MLLEFTTGAIDGTVAIGLKPESTTISVDLVPSYYFDRKGRLMGGHQATATYRRTLDNRIIAKWREPADGQWVRRRRALSADEVRRFIADVHVLATKVQRALVAGDFVPLSPEDVEPSIVADAQARLAAITAYDYDALNQDARLFNAIYAPIGILPPDQYLALVLQATLSCPWNRCVFCAFYRGQSFRIRCVDEFRQHIEQVKGFHGPALNYWKSIFLADANALVIPQQRLMSIFDALNTAFDIEPAGLPPAERRAWYADHPQGFDGIYSFVSALDGIRRDPDEFATLAERGLRRAYIGLESGADALLRFLNKPNTAEQAVQAVRTIRAGGVAVGVIIMLGIGGDKYADGHVEHTIRAINAMELGPGDILYFSDFVDSPDVPYDERAAAEGIRPLTWSELRQQEEAMRAGFAFPDGRPKISVYDVREFAY